MGVILDTSIWVDVERGRLAPADVATVTGEAPVYLASPVIAELQYGVDSHGKPSTHRVNDLWLAALAIQHGMKVATQNEKDFADVPGLDVVALPPRPRARGAR